MSDAVNWDTSAANNNSASPDGFKEGMLPGGVNDSAREVMAAVKRYINDTAGANATTGSGGDYVLTADQSGITAYTDGLVFMFRANHTNSGAATLDVNAIGEKDIKKNHSEDLDAGDIQQNQLVLVAYQSTDDVFEMLSSPGTGFAGEVVTGDTAIENSDGGKIYFCDTSSNDITLTLPDLADVVNGWYIRAIKTDAANDLIIEDDGSTTLETLESDEAIVYIIAGPSQWYTYVTGDTEAETFVGFSVYLASDQNVVGANTWDKIDHDTEVYDLGGNFSAGKFVTPSDGKYMFFAATQSSGLSNGMQLMHALYVNSSLHKKLAETDSPKDSNTMQVSGGAVLDLSAGDEVEHWGQIGGASRDFKGGSTLTYFMGVKL